VLGLAGRHNVLLQHLYPLMCCQPTVLAAPVVHVPACRAPPPCMHASGTTMFGCCCRAVTMASTFMFCCIRLPGLLIASFACPRMRMCMHDIFSPACERSIYTHSHACFSVGGAYLELLCPCTYEWCNGAARAMQSMHAFTPACCRGARAHRHGSGVDERDGVLWHLPAISPREPPLATARAVLCMYLRHGNLIACGCWGGGESILVRPCALLASQSVRVE
jgi:hypothetical protein